MRGEKVAAAVVTTMAFGTLSMALVDGGDVLMIALGLALAATGMEMFRRAQPRGD
jgi:hypothetical protein